MHVTLAFLGEQPADRLNALLQIGSVAATAGTPGTLRLGAVGSFGTRRAPRVLWVGLNGELDKLQALYAHLDRGLRDGGFAVEERAFSPHVTLARRRPNATGGAPADWPPQMQAMQFPLQELTLFESRLGPRGATYTPLGRFALGG